MRVTSTHSSHRTSCHTIERVVCVTTQDCTSVLRQSEDRPFVALSAFRCKCPEGGGSGFTLCRIWHWPLCSSRRCGIWRIETHYILIVVLLWNLLWSVRTCVDFTCDAWHTSTVFAVGTLTNCKTLCVCKRIAGCLTFCVQSTACFGAPLWHVISRHFGSNLAKKKRRQTMIWK